MNYKLPNTTIILEEDSQRLEVKNLFIVNSGNGYIKGPSRDSLVVNNHFITGHTHRLPNKFEKILMKFKISSPYSYKIVQLTNKESE